MKLPKVLLLGTIGQVGWELRRVLAPIGPVIGVDFPDVDLTEADSARNCVREHQPGIVINAAAYTAVDKAESDTEKAMRINGIAPAILAEEAKRLGALLIHFSTDYIFDGTKRTPYLETDPPNPINAYGRSKLAGDEAVRSVGGPHLIFRLCWVYGSRGQNFLLTMLRLARERESLRVVADQSGCPTWSRMIAQASGFALQRWFLEKDRAALTGTYHLAASDSITWHGFASAIIDHIPPDQRKCINVQPISTAEYPTPARRPVYSVLGCEKLERTFGLKLPDWRESLRQVLEP
jgi:dTDP-4-dehydrorhamnose reductase